MDIDDILKQKPKDLDKFLTEEMYKTAGKELVDRMFEVLASEEAARRWFYSRRIGLEGERPYDYCKEGKHSEIRKLLGRIEWGVFS